MVLGAAIGMEREVKGKPTGLRTNILICVGATLFTDMSVAIANSGVHLGDPGRIAAQIVVGVGFIGAGTILQGGGGVVTGLTSAATIWVVAAIGVAIGSGRYIEAVGTTLLVGLVLAGLGRIEYRLRRVRRVGSCTIRTRPQTSPEVVHRIVVNQGLRVLEEDIYDHAEDRVFELRVSGPARQFDVVCEALLSHEAILGVHVA